MIKEKRILYNFIVILAFALFSVSCSLGGGEPKPWEGKKIEKMYGGSLISPISFITNGKVGEIYWFYIDAGENAFYHIGMAYTTLPWWMKEDPNLAPSYGVAVMTGYKEDGTVFGRADPYNKESGGYTIDYYSPVNQKLYISFEIKSAGYLTFYYDRTDGGNNDNNDNSANSAVYTFTSIAEFEAWLSAHEKNSAETAYNVKMNVDDLGGDYNTSGSLGNVLVTNERKYVNLDLSESTITTIGECSFSTCRLTNVIIGNSVTSIGYFAFGNCDLNVVTIPDSVTSIGECAFVRCKSLYSVTIPDSVTSIGDRAFDECTNLQTIQVGSGNTAYCSEQGVLYTKDKTALLQYTTGLTRSTFTITNSVTSIGDYAFRGCTSLTGVTIPDSVTSIGQMAFYDCTGLNSVNIPNNVNSIGGGAFDYTAWLNNQPNGLIYAGKVALIYKGNMSANTRLTLRDGTKGIAGAAFRDCTRLTGITIPNSVTSIGRSTFARSGLTSITIPDSVTSIGDNTFDKCTSLAGITIPSSVTSIGNYAFYECTSLVDITIPSSVTSIGNYAFYGCSSLISVTFETGSNIADANIGIGAFFNDLRIKYYTGKAGTYTRASGGSTWTKQ